MALATARPGRMLEEPGPHHKGYEHPSIRAVTRGRANGLKAPWHRE